jgi:hypothetical protein
VQLPIFPQGVTHITSEVAFECKEGQVCYFNGHLPVFVHEENDVAAFQQSVSDQRQCDADPDCPGLWSAAGNRQTLREALTGRWSRGIFCAG